MAFETETRPETFETETRSFLMTKISARNSFPLIQSTSGPDPEFMKHFTDRIQSKFNKIRHSPDSVQSNAQLCYRGDHGVTEWAPAAVDDFRRSRTRNLNVNKNWIRSRCGIFNFYWSGVVPFIKSKLSLTG